jgi:hypothetical protein
LSHAYLTRLKQSKEKIDPKFLNIYTEKAKKKEPLNASERDIVSDVMLSAYLIGKDGRIILTTLKEAYLDLAKKRDDLLERLTESE